MQRKYKIGVCGTEIIFVSVTEYARNGLSSMVCLVWSSMVMVSNGLSHGCSFSSVSIYPMTIYDLQVTAYAPVIFC